MGKQSFDSLFQMTDFRSYVHSWVHARGRGEFRKIALTLNIHTTLVSQIFSGKKCLTEEQAIRLCHYMSLNSLETDYFVKLVQIERAGNEPLKSLFKRHLKQLQLQSSQIKERVPATKLLSEADRAIFYSNWQYSLIRLLTSIPELRTIEKISARLDLPISTVQEVLDFLTSRRLCREQDGQYHRTDKNTHVESDSHLSIRHHHNWRVKSMSLQEQMKKEDLAFTAPISVSKADTENVRKILLNAISEIAKIVEKSDAEDVVYLGIDWIKI
jgi:uncharacterized protein (TIGR02147 family)